MLLIRNVAKGFNVESPAVIKEISGMRGTDAGVPASLMCCLNAEEIAKFKQVLKLIKDQLSSASISFVV